MRFRRELRPKLFDCGFGIADLGFKKNPQSQIHNPKLFWRKAEDLNPYARKARQFSGLLPDRFGVPSAI